MIARSEEEFERYQIMDVERRRAEMIPGVKSKPRLVEEDEIPGWMLKNDEEVRREAKQLKKKLLSRKWNNVVFPSDCEDHGVRAGGASVRSRQPNAQGS